jgi:hypothetical protein
MEITNAQYVQYKNRNVSISCTINGKFHSVPISEDNRHYVMIMKLVEAGELTIADADE